MGRESRRRAKSAGYSFQTGIVKEFISDPDVYLDRPAADNSVDPGIGGLFSAATSLLSSMTIRDILIKKNDESENKGGALVANSIDAETMPKNSIIAYITDDAKSTNGQLPFICYPFFPSHFTLPLKPGEYVWIVRENNLGRDTYYWMCRKHGSKQTEDLNYTHFERFVFAADQFKKERDTEKNNVITSPIDPRDFADFRSPSNSNLPSGVGNNSIAYGSYAYKEEFTGEPVPDLRKKCGDTVIQGSNNAAIHLTTEKFETLEDRSRDFHGGLTLNAGMIGRNPLSPAIDITVGRKKSELSALKNTIGDLSENNGLKIIKNKRSAGYSTLEYYEIDKTSSILKEAEDPNRMIDLDSTNCGARLYMSNNCSVDNVFGTSFDVLDSYGGSSLSAYSDHTRIIADGTLRLTNRLGQSFLDFDPEGNVVLKSSVDNGQQYLSLRSDGTSRLQSKSSGKIELSVSNNNGDTPEVVVKEEEIILQSNSEGGIKAVSVGGSGAGVFGIGPILKILDDIQFFTLTVPQQTVALTPIFGPIFAPIVAPILSADDKTGAPGTAKSSDDSAVISVLKKIATKNFYAE